MSNDLLKAQMESVLDACVELQRWRDQKPDEALLRGHFGLAPSPVATYLALEEIADLIDELKHRRAEFMRAAIQLNGTLRKTARAARISHNSVQSAISQKV